MLIQNHNAVETNLVKSILPQEIIQKTKIIPAMESSSLTVKVIFESENEENTEKLKQKFFDKLDRKSFDVVSSDFSKLLEAYKKSPDNFISVNTRNLLKNKDYDSIYNQALERIYSPLGISITEMNQDPFMLLTDFLYQNNIFTKNHNINGKYYDTEILKLNSDSNNIISDLVKIKKECSDRNNKIYLAGTPVHTYYTTIATMISVNVICFLITVLIIFLIYYYFKDFKLLLPVVLSLGFGLLAGYSVTKYLFSNFHIITILFGTTLIGIGIDYSFHYIFNENPDKKFYRDLTISLFSTITAFSLLYLLKTDILSQIATFTISGLTAVFLFIILVYPNIKFSAPKILSNPKLIGNTKIFVIALIAIVILFGLPKIGFNDTLTSLYKPNANLKKSEILFNKIANQEYEKSIMIAVKGDNAQKLLENEEKIISEIDGGKYICISKFIPSVKRQQENISLVKNLYNNSLKKFSDILTPFQINEIRKKENTPLVFDIKSFPFFKSMLLDDNTSLIISFAGKPAHLENAEIIDFQGTISEYLKKYRINLIKLMPAIYFVLFAILLAFYGFKSAVKMFLPIILSQIFVISFISLIGIKLNLFTLLGLILTLGFTIDYSIFAQKNSPKGFAAIFLACITTTLSFALLIFTTFKLVSMLALTTSLGILFSYLLIKMFIKDNENMV